MKNLTLGLLLAVACNSEPEIYTLEGKVTNIEFNPMVLKLIYVTTPDSNGDCFVQYYSEDEWRITVQDNNKKDYVIISDVCNVYSFSNGISVELKSEFPFKDKRIEMSSLSLMSDSHSNRIENYSHCPGKMDHSKLVKGNKTSCYSKYH